MKTKRFVLLIVGFILLFASVILATMALVALFQGLSENFEIFIVSVVLSVLFLVLNLLCLRARRRLLYDYYSKKYADVNRVVIAHTDTDFISYTVPFESYEATRGRLRNILNLVIHFNSGAVSIRRVKPNSVEYRFLAPFIQ